MHTCVCCLCALSKGQMVPDTEDAAPRKNEMEEPPGESDGALESGAPPPADSWEEVADGDIDPLLTPEEGDDDLDYEVVGEEEAIIKPKKKLIPAEEMKSKKEHVNVVFIGHVGKQITLDYPNTGVPLQITNEIIK